MVNNTSKIERIGFISKHTTNSPLKRYNESYVKAMISNDHKGFGLYPLV